jgi:hypothetical protein
MNQLGQTAQEYYRDYLPNRFASIPDSSAYFHQLGDDLAQLVTSAAFEIAGPDPQGETYLEKVGRLNAATMQARELILDEQLYSLEPEESETDQTLADQNTRPDLDLINQERHQINDLLDELLY